MDVPITIVLKDTDVAILGTVTKDIPGYMGLLVTSSVESRMATLTKNLRTVLHNQIDMASDAQLAQVAQSYGVSVSG